VGVGANERRVCGAFSWIPGERGRSNMTRCGCGDLGFGRLGLQSSAELGCGGGTGGG